MADKQYKVTITDPLSFPADRRVRSGITVLKQDGYQGELSDEQLEEINADSYLTVEEVKADKPKATTKPSGK